MRFQYQKPSVMSFQEGRQAVTSTLANISARQERARVAALEQQRAMQVAKQKQVKDDVKARMGKIDGFSFENMTVDGRNNLKAALDWGSQNVANMSAQEFGSWVRNVKSMVAQDQEWYKSATSQFDNYIKLMDVGERDKANSKLDGREYYIDMNDFKMKEGMLESPITRGGQGVQGVFDPSRLGYVNESGFVPITTSLYYPSEGLGPVTRELEYYANITDIYNSQKRGSAKSYKDVMSSTKTEDRDPSYYDNSAINAFQDTIWTKKNHLQSLFDQYEVDNGVLSSGSKNVMLESKNRENAINLANQAGLAESEIEDINNLYNYGIDKTKEWGMQYWKKQRETSSGSGGSGGGGSGGNKNREPDITQTSAPAPWYQFNSAVPVAEEEVNNIQAAGGFRAFNSSVTVKDTSTTRTNIPSADLKVEAFAMDSRYRLHVYMSVPKRVKVWKYNNTEYFSEAEVKAAMASMYDNNPPPTPREITKYEDEFVVLRPFNMINQAKGRYVSDQWSMTSSDEDDLYNNILRKIGYHSLTALGREEAKPEGMAKIGFRYLKEIYNK
jgi:hypothetical protein